ncbi:hypothetical protein [Actinoplanes sp. NPDC049681]|uniref:hypothetical protein n=1 Tax=Actinoplanes sp. NPDC049681 TaxID=3363905 RepID=UPI0037933882
MVTSTLRAADEAATHLPITADIDTVHLIHGTPEPGGPWHTAAQLPLGPRRAATQNSLPSGSAITT